MMPREILTIILLVLLIVCAIAVNIIPNLLQSVIIFMAYSSIMSVVWILMESPDLGITEAAVGAGVSGIMFLMTLKKVHDEDEKKPEDIAEEKKQLIAKYMQSGTDLIRSESGVAQTNTNLPRSESGVAQKETNLPRSESSLVQAETNLPRSESTSDKDGQEPAKTSGPSSKEDQS